jgi:hypothetical protein
MKEFQEKLDKLEALMNELDLFIHIEGKKIIVCDFYHSVKTNGFNLTPWDFKRFKRESGGKS